MAWRQDQFAEDEVQEGSQNRQEEEGSFRRYVGPSLQLFSPKWVGLVMLLARTYTCRIFHLMSVSSGCL